MIDGILPVLKNKKRKTTSTRTQPPKAYYFKSWHTRITLEKAQEEQPDERLFGPNS